MPNSRQRLNPESEVLEAWDGDDWVPVVPPSPGNTSPYGSRQDRILHLEANARNRGMPEGSLFEYDRDRRGWSRNVRGGSMNWLMRQFY